MEDAETSTLEKFWPEMQAIARRQDISAKSPMFNVAVYVHRLALS